MFRNIYLNSKVHFLSFIRNKNAFFWTLSFPIFLYIVFYSIFSTFSGDNYGIFLLTGILGMTLTADGLFGVGSIIKSNYQNGTIRMLSKMPTNILSYFVGLVVNRFFILSILLLLLNLACYLFSGLYLGLDSLPFILLGMFVGLWVFSFIGLSLSFMDMKNTSDKSVSNILYFLFIFTSSTFYELNHFNADIAKVTAFLPLNQVLGLLRGTEFNLMILLLWMGVPVLSFYFLFNKLEYSR